MTNRQCKTVNYKWLIRSVDVVTEMHGNGRSGLQPPNHGLQGKAKNIGSLLKSGLLQIPSQFSVNMQCLYKYSIKVYTHTHTRRFLLCIYIKSRT